MLIRFIPVWKSAPSLRMVVPLALGIVAGWYLKLTGVHLAIGAAISVLALLMASRSNWRHRIGFGLLASCNFFVLGMALLWLHLPKEHAAFVGRHYQPGQVVMATLQEPLVAKAKSYKALASVSLVDDAGRQMAVSGKVVVYFKKDSTPPTLGYGSTVLFSKAMQPIRSSGNPGAFNYERYAMFNGMFYQVFLAPSDYVVTPLVTTNRFQQLLFTTRQWVIETFQRHIPGPAEAGLAEALLIGYRNDLDKDLVEQYATTGVVHIIAISGMHLGLIYGLLLVLLKPFSKTRRGLLLSGVCIIAALWFFSLLTGAAPSITRSALMFTVIVAGQCFSRKSSIYNSLSLSALVLLLFNPFNLWDIGFQLSYAAVLSIAIFGKPVQDWFAPRLKPVKLLWQLVAVTLAAQVLTLPLVLFHFHQFPTYFLLANLVAVPLSSFVLYGLLLLLPLSALPAAAKFLGLAIFYGIGAMNSFIGWISSLPHASLSGIYLSLWQALAMFAVIAALGWWLLYASSRALVLAIACALVFFGLWTAQQHQIENQRMLVVYNVPGKSAVDLIDGASFTFIGDSTLLEKGFAQNFHLQPSRIQRQVSFANSLPLQNTLLTAPNHPNVSMLLLHQSIETSASKPLKINVLVVGGGVKTKPLEVLRLVQCQTVVLDGSVPTYRSAKWQVAADSLHLRFHAVQQQGAFQFQF